MNEDEKEKQMETLQQIVSIIEQFDKPSNSHIHKCTAVKVLLDNNCELPKRIVELFEKHKQNQSLLIQLCTQQSKYSLAVDYTEKILNKYKTDKEIWVPFWQIDRLAKEIFIRDRELFARLEKVIEKEFYGQQ